jgi:hypothetical protein
MEGVAEEPWKSLGQRVSRNNLSTPGKFRPRHD